MRAQTPPPVPPPQYFKEFSTHDATTTLLSLSSNLPEAWADVKSTGAMMPGKGWTFCVGTVGVTTTFLVDQPRFSGESIALPPDPANQNGFRIASGATIGQKQIVVLQARGPDLSNPSSQNQDQTIRWQAYFYGDSGLGDSAIGRPATNARAVSVWPVLGEEGELDLAETRIAICGESFECRLPNSQFTNGPNGMGGRMKFSGPGPFATNFPRGLPSGFIAVYRGNGTHLWTHHFFFEDLAITPGAPEGACAITDVSIRVEEVDGQMRDVVTYCGISSFGLRSNETTALTPLKPFDVTATTQVDGTNDNGLGQWDGIVGRISNAHSPNPVQGTATIKEFHSVVGGREQDGLWGIAEMPENRFVVVGSTATMRGTNPAISNFAFPFTNGGPPGVSGGGSWPSVTHCVATMLVFDASNTRNTSSNDLILEDAVSVGTAGFLDPQETIVAAAVARDVHVAYDSFSGNGIFHRIAVVGSTNDNLLFNSTSPILLPTTAFSGVNDGFLITAIDKLLPGPLFVASTFQGGAGDSGWCGVASWNEFRDHITVLGWTEESQNNQDLEAVSMFVDTPSVSGTPSTPSNALLRLRRATVPTPALEIPAAMGQFVATSPPSPAVTDWDEFGLRSPAGGGITMDERGRLNLVGSTDPGNPPVASAFPVVGGPLARTWLSGVDAVRVVPTMLPHLVGRTDRSGEQTHLMGTIPSAPAGRTGSTTPTCALLPFGRQLDGSGTVPPLHRMLIDWEGLHPFASPVDPQTQQQVSKHSLLVDRPPASWQWVGTVVQFGVPTAPPAAPAVLPSGIENWVPSGVALPILFAGGQLSSRIPLILPPAPSGGLTFSAQVVSASLTSFACTSDVFAATPAIVFSYQ